MRLAVVEDNPELAWLLAQGLKAEGYETDVLTTAAAARAAVSTTRYAALILDLGLPDGDGLSILREIRQSHDPLPVLVLTARGGVHDRVNGLRSGADDYLVKPFALEELVARLEALLRRPGQLLGRIPEDAFSRVIRETDAPAGVHDQHRVRRELQQLSRQCAEFLHLHSCDRKTGHLRGLRNRLRGNRSWHFHAIPAS